MSDTQSVIIGAVVVIVGFLVLFLCCGRNEEKEKNIPFPKIGVVICRPDGGLCNMESIVIGSLLRAGVEVPNLSPEEAKMRLRTENQFPFPVLVGTYRTNNAYAECELVHYLDVRLVDNQNRILFTEVFEASDKDLLVSGLIRDLKAL